MKKFLMAFMLVVFTLGFANAQTARKESPKKEKTTLAKQQQPATAVKTHDKSQAAPSSTHLKADGTPDKRFKENKAKTHLKKNGTPDKRYKENKKQK